MILNKAELIHNASDRMGRRARRLVVSALEAGLASVDPHKLVSEHVKRRGDKLLVDREVIRLGNFRRIFVVGAGKASGEMANALEAILDDKLESGLVVVPAGQPRPQLDHVKLIEAPHPIPDENSMSAAKQLVGLVRGLNKRDLLICLISGGGSALLCLPAEPLTLEDKVEVTRLVMNASATIAELNTIRKHLSSLKGGWLAKQSGAGKILGLVISDVVGDRLDSIASGPISPDPTTFSDAITILRKYSLWESTPSTAARVLREGAEGRIPETPKAGNPCFRKVRQYILGDNRIACIAAQRYLQSNGIPAKVLTSSVTGEALSWDRSLVL